MNTEKLIVAVSIMLGVIISMVIVQIKSKEYGPNWKAALPMIGAAIVAMGIFLFFFIGLLDVGGAFDRLPQ